MSSRRPTRGGCISGSGGRHFLRANRSARASFSRRGSASDPGSFPRLAWPPDVARQVAPPPRVGFLGRSLTGTGGPYATVYLDALLDQVVRANQQGLIARALVLSERRLALQSDGEAAAWRLESLRRAGHATEAESLLRSLPEAVAFIRWSTSCWRCSIATAGKRRGPGRFSASVAGSLPETAVQRALRRHLPTGRPTWMR